MSAFFLSGNLGVRNPDKLATYARDVAPVVERYAGRYRAVGAATTTVEGAWAPACPVLIEFDGAASGPNRSLEEPRPRCGRRPHRRHSRHLRS